MLLRRSFRLRRFSCNLSGKGVKYKQIIKKYSTCDPKKKLFSIGLLLF